MFWKCKKNKSDAFTIIKDVIRTIQHAKLSAINYYSANHYNYCQGYMSFYSFTNWIILDVLFHKAEQKEPVNFRRKRDGNTS